MVIIQQCSGYRTGKVVVTRENMWLSYKGYSGYNTKNILCGYHTGIFWLSYGGYVAVSYGEYIEWLTYGIGSGTIRRIYGIKQGI